MKTSTLLLIWFIIITMLANINGQSTKYFKFLEESEVGQGLAYAKGSEEVTNSSFFTVSNEHQLEFACNNWVGTTWYYVPINVPDSVVNLLVEFPSFQIIRKPKYDGNAPQLFSYIISDRLPSTFEDLNYCRNNNLWINEYGTPINKKGDALKNIQNIRADIPESTIEKFAGNVIYLIYRVGHSWSNYSMEFTFASPEITWTEKE